MDTEEHHQLMSKSLLYEHKGENVKPVTPSECVMLPLPDEVILAVNELLQNKIVTDCVTITWSELQIAVMKRTKWNEKWDRKFDIEEPFRRAGWEVTLYKAYNEHYETTYTFQKPRPPPYSE